MFISDDQMLTKLHRGVPENDFSVPRIFFFSLMECLYEFNKAGKGFSPLSTTILDNNLEKGKIVGLGKPQAWKGAA